jgi:hypothetical protein
LPDLNLSIRQTETGHFFDDVADRGSFRKAAPDERRRIVQLEQILPGLAEEHLVPADDRKRYTLSDHQMFFTHS